MFRKRSWKVRFLDYKVLKVCLGFNFTLIYSYSYEYRKENKMGNNNEKKITLNFVSSCYRFLACVSSLKNEIDVLNNWFSRLTATRVMTRTVCVYMLVWELEVWTQRYKKFWNLGKKKLLCNCDRQQLVYSIHWAKKTTLPGRIDWIKTQWIQNKWRGFSWEVRQKKNRGCVTSRPKKVGYDISWENGTENVIWR
jgi:hypothetical protein